MQSKVLAINQSRIWVKLFFCESAAFVGHLFYQPAAEVEFLAYSVEFAIFKDGFKLQVAVVVIVTIQAVYLPLDVVGDFLFYHIVFMVTLFDFHHSHRLCVLR